MGLYSSVLSKARHTIIIIKKNILQGCVHDPGMICTSLNHCTMGVISGNGIWLGRRNRVEVHECQGCGDLEDGCVLRRMWKSTSTQGPASRSQPPPSEVKQPTGNICPEHQLIPLPALENSQKREQREDREKKKHYKVIWLSHNPMKGS